MFRKEYFIKWKIGDQEGHGIYWIRAWENVGDILEGIAQRQNVEISDIAIINARKL